MRARGNMSFGPAFRNSVFACLNTKFISITDKLSQHMKFASPPSYLDISNWPTLHNCKWVAHYK